jgi:ADP-heptose:LPS heptosyltransferase
MTAFARGTRKIGRSDAREAAGLFYRETIALPPGGTNAHAVDILARFLNVFRLEPNIGGALQFAEPDAAAPAGGVADRIPSGDGPLFVVFPDSRRPEKNWPGFGGLARRLLERDGRARVVWAGSQRAGAGAELHVINAAGGARFADLTGATPIDALPGLMRRATCVVANDSGPMHLAAALGTRVLGVFGPTDPNRFGPYPIGHPARRTIRAPEGDLTRLAVDEVLAVLDETVAADASP